MTDEIHSCSYYCQNLECIKKQRDELRDQLFAMKRMFIGTETHEMFKARLANAIEDMPFGDTAASFAQFVRDFK